MSVTDAGGVEAESSDSIEVADVPAVTIASAINYDVDVNDDISATDSPTTFVADAGGVEVDVHDSVALSEDIEAAATTPPDIESSVSDAISVSDVPDISISDVDAADESVNDGIAVSDVASVTVSDINGQVYDDVTLGEMIVVSTSGLFIDVSDSIEATDTVDAQVEDAATIVIVINDEITVIDVGSILDASDINAFASDQIEVTDSVVASTRRIPRLMTPGVVVKMTEYNVYDASTIYAIVVTHEEP